MRRFNPDKELRKIRKGNKNKILYSTITLLLIVLVGSTYALYQVRHTNKIVYTTVEKFVNKDIILSVKLDDKDESVNEFPTADSGYVYSHTECEKENITDITWNEDQRSLNMNSKGPDKCTVYFAKSPFNLKSCEDKSMSECLLEEGQKFPEYLAFDDPDQNGRYYGKDPSNYIWFNCDDYSNPTEDTCERWRIIGSFKNIEKANDDGSTTEQNLVKITRADEINILLSYDNQNNVTMEGSSSLYGTPDWNYARLMKLLNPGYEDEDIGGSLYYDYSNHIGQETLCYSGRDKDSTIACDFTNIALKNDFTRNRIETVKWRLGPRGWNSPTASNTYNQEKSNLPNHALSQIFWSGRVAFPAPSDYLYATSGNEEQSRNYCLNINFSYYYNKSMPGCIENNWLGFNSDKTEAYYFFLNSQANSNSTSVGILELLKGFINSQYAESARFIKPTIYLTHDTKVTGGNGTYDNPYTINVN